MGWTHGQNEKTRDYRKDQRQRSKKVQKMKKTTANVGGLCEERSEKGKGQQQGPMEKITKVGIQRSDN